VLPYLKGIWDDEWQDRWWPARLRVKHSIPTAAAAAES